MDTIGNLLRTERLKKKLEIVDVEQATGIRAMYVKALEEGRYDVLPGVVYVKGFIRNYGNYLELDGGHLVQLYTEANAKTEQLPIGESPVATTAEVRTGSGKKTLSVVAVALILIAAAWGLYEWQKGLTPQHDPAPQSRPVATAVAPPAAPASTVAYPPAGATVTPVKAVVLVARYTDRCWTSVIADGKTIYEGIPQAGVTMTWEADRQILLNLGNAGAVELSYNGQPQGKLGERGDVVVKTYAISGVVPTAPAVKP
jgi:hypothetical protein